MDAALSIANNQHERISKSLIEDVCTRLATNKRVRQSLPGGGTLNIDRLLPFLCVYRRNPARRDEGTSHFVTAEASFLVAPGEAPVRKGLQQLVQRIAETASRQLGAFLVLEVWSGESDRLPKSVDEVTGELLLPRAGFRILTRRPHRPEGTVATLEFALQRLKVHGQTADVEVNLHARNHPSAMKQLIAEADAEAINCHVLGLEVRPIYRDGQSGEVYDRELRLLRRGVARSLKKAFFTFSLNRTNVRPQHYFSLGRRSLPQQVLTIDRQLAEVSGQFKFLLLVTPVNAQRSWHEFSESKYQKEPVFQYRPLDADPLLLKRRLMKIATERVEDPTLAHVLRQTQDELDRQITMLGDIGTRCFLPGSLQVFGGVEPSLSQLAKELLRHCPPRDRNGNESQPTLDGKAFAKRAAREIKYYRRQATSFSAEAIVRDDIYSGLLTTGGNLLIGHESSISERRVEALLHHEVGTHLVTYYNGQAQPLRLLQVGLAGYDALQEGLAVLSEYLVGGLSSERMRTLAARAVSAEKMILGAPFTDTFRMLVDEYGFEPRTAYTITLRIYRGGGLTKDAMYLRGLVEIINYVGQNGKLETLLVGKLAMDHIPIVRELLHRGVLRQPMLRPRYLDDPQAMDRLKKVQKCTTVIDLLNNDIEA